MNQVERGMPGFERGKNLKKMGMKAQDTSELFFDNVHLGPEALLGKLNHGFYYLMNELPQVCRMSGVTSDIVVPSFVFVALFFCH